MSTRCEATYNGTRCGLDAGHTGSHDSDSLVGGFVWDDAALAAGVGVPPDARDEVAQSAENADVREGAERSLKATQEALIGTQQVRDSYKDRLELMRQSYEAKVQDLQRETSRCSALQRDLDNERQANRELWERVEELRHNQACQSGLGSKRSPDGERTTGASKPSIGIAKPTNRTSSSAGEGFYENVREFLREIWEGSDALRPEVEEAIANLDALYWVGVGQAARETRRRDGTQKA